MVRRVLGAVLLSLLVACGSGAASAPSAPPAGAPAGEPAGSADLPYVARAGETPTNVHVALCAVSGGFVHLYTAVEADLFRKYGLNVELVTISGSAAALAALSSNEIQFLYCAADATIAGLATGIDGKLVAAPLHGLPYVMIARPDVHTFADLKGKSIGVPRVGDLADKLSRLALERHGLVPNQDVEIRPIGGSQPERYRAMLADIVQANAITPPLDAQARKDGMNVIYDLASLGIPFVYSSVHTSGTMLRSQPAIVQRFVAAMADSVYFTEKNPDVARQALRKTLALDDPEVLDATYQAYARKLIDRRMTVPSDAVDATIDDARKSGTNVSVGGAADIATNAFVDDLARTGFLERLWGPELQ